MMKSSQLGNKQNTHTRPHAHTRSTQQSSQRRGHQTSTRTPPQKKMAEMKNEKREKEESEKAREGGGSWIRNEGEERREKRGAFFPSFACLSVLGVCVC